MPQEIKKLVAGTRLPKPDTRNSEYFERGDDVPLDTFPEKRTRDLLRTGGLLVQHGENSPTDRNVAEIPLGTKSKKKKPEPAAESAKK